MRRQQQSAQSHHQYPFVRRDPRAVARLVRGYVHGLQDNGMLATLKHFPGHGDTDADSHIGLPSIRVDYARLDSVELVPFRAGIDAGAQVVMSAHIAFPVFTGDAPATLSASMLNGRAARFAQVQKAWS